MEKIAWSAFPPAAKSGEYEESPSAEIVNSPPGAAMEDAPAVRLRPFFRN